jgi:hypothetical protein
MKTIEDLKLFFPCSDGLTFAEKCGNLSDAWDQCPRGDWLLWSLREFELINKPIAIRLAVEFAQRLIQICENKYPSDGNYPIIWDFAHEFLLEHSHSMYTVGSADEITGFTAIFMHFAVNPLILPSSPSTYLHDDARKKERKWQANKIRELIPNPFALGSAKVPLAAVDSGPRNING